MTKTFHMTNGMRIGTTILTALLRAGVPLENRSGNQTAS